MEKLSTTLRYPNNESCEVIAYRVMGELCAARHPRHRYCWLALHAQSGLSLDPRSVGRRHFRTRGLAVEAIEFLTRFEVGRELASLDESDLQNVMDWIAEHDTQLRDAWRRACLAAVDIGPSRRRGR